MVLRWVRWQDPQPTQIPGVIGRPTLALARWPFLLVVTLLQCLLGTYKEDVLPETGRAQTETAVLGTTINSMGSSLSLREHSKAVPCQRVIARIAHNELRDQSPFSQRCQLTRSSLTLPITSTLGQTLGKSGILLHGI